MLFPTDPSWTSPPARRSLLFRHLALFFFEQLSNLTAAELSKRHHHRLLFHARLKLSALPQMRGPDGDARENSQLFLGDA